MQAETAAKPFVKWAGGKSRLLPELLARVPAKVGTYVEPFCGGAALFFALAAEKRFAHARLTDLNEDLLAAYRAIRDDVEGLIDALADYTYDQDLFYEVRERDATRMNDVERGARFIFLNRTCFNGLWRVNASGKFNVPFGRYKKPRIQDPEGLRACAKALHGVEIAKMDFADAVKRLGAKDFVYFDPPYVPVSSTADFTAYAAGGFRRRDQERLVDVMRALAARGVRGMLSNAATPETRQLYAEFETLTVKMPRSINSDPKKRREIDELLVFIDPVAKKKRRKTA